MALMKTEEILTGSQIALACFNEENITDKYVAWLKDDEVNKFLRKPNKNITIEEVREYCLSLLASDDNYFFAIIHNQSTEHIGNVRLGPIDYTNRLCQFGMMIGEKSYYGKGIATEVMRLSIKFFSMSSG